MKWFKAAKASGTVFGTIGTITGLAGQYASGFKGDKFNAWDIGPQFFPKFLGRLHHGHNKHQQMLGEQEMLRHEARVRAENGFEPIPSSRFQQKK